MFINKQWRVLTIGDGDLSFSWSAFQDRQLTNITASALDGEKTFHRKYQHNSLAKLRKCGVNVHFELDICNPASFNASLEHAFDLVIFQFPLIPAFTSKSEFESKGKLDKNTLNRLLICQFLKHSFSYFLDPDGQQLAYVTSKDVKPYSHWNIENLNPQTDEIAFLGWTPFSQTDFPHYQLRNVDRDKVLKSTASKTYAWGSKVRDYSALKLNPSSKHQADHCPLCGKGPFTQKADWQTHQGSSFHQRLAGYEQLWQTFLSASN